MKIELSKEEVEKLKELINELANFDKMDSYGNSEPWNINDVYENLEIHEEILSIISPLIDKL